MRCNVISAIAALFLVVGLSSCSDDDPEATTTTAPPDSTTSTTVSPSTVTTEVNAPNVSVPGTNEITLLTDVRAARQPAGDRVTFQFSGSLPGYDIGYIKPPLTSDGEGAPVALAGNVIVSARFANADNHIIEGEKVRNSFSTKRFTPGDTQNVVELVQSGDFEANVTWGIGLKTKVPFKVTTLTNPSRVVIDFEG